MDTITCANGEISQLMATRKTKITVRDLSISVSVAGTISPVGGVYFNTCTYCNVERVEVLPFHQMGAYKWERLGLEYTLKETQPPTSELCEQACEVFRKAGLKAC